MSTGGGEVMKAVVVNETTGEIEYIQDFVEVDNSVSHEVEVVTVDDFRRRLRNPLPHPHPHQNSTSTTQSIVKPLVSTLSSPPSGATPGPGQGQSGSFQVQLRNTPSLLRNSRGAGRNLGQLQVQNSNLNQIQTLPQIPLQLQSQQIQLSSSLPQQSLNSQIQIPIQIQQQQTQQIQIQNIQGGHQIFEFLPVIQQGGSTGFQLTSPSVLPPASAQFLRTFDTSGIESPATQLIVYNCGDNQFDILPGQEHNNVQLRLCEVIQTDGGEHEIVEGVAVGEDGQFQTADGNTIYICSEPQDGDDEDGEDEQTFSVPMVGLDDGEEYTGIQVVDEMGSLPILQDEDGNIYEVHEGHEGLQMEFPVPMPIPRKRRKKMGGPAKALGANAAMVIAGGGGEGGQTVVTGSPVPVKVPKKPLNELKCLETGCLFAGVNVSELRKHLSTAHFFSFDEEVIMFPSDKDFKCWRETYERERMVSFIFRGGTKKISRDQAVTYLICHRSGHYKPTMKDQSLRKRKMKPQGSCKMNGYCTAGIKLLKNLESGEVRCEICHTHYGHPLDNGAIPHLRVNNVLRKIIRKKFEEGMSFNQVVQYLHHNPDHLEGLRLLDRRAVRNIYDKFRKNPKEFFDEDSYDHENEDLRSPGDPIGCSGSGSSITGSAVIDEDSLSESSPKSPFVLHLINDSSNSVIDMDTASLDVKPLPVKIKSEPADSELQLVLASPAESQSDGLDIDVSNDNEKDQVDISGVVLVPAAIPDESQTNNQEQEVRADINENGEETSISNTHEEPLTGDVSSLRARSRSSQEVNSNAAQEVEVPSEGVRDKVNVSKTAEAEGAVTSSIVEDNDNSPKPLPITPKKRGRKPKPKLVVNCENSQSETEASMSDSPVTVSSSNVNSNPRRSCRERKPKLFHDDQDDCRFFKVVKVESSCPTLTSSTDILQCQSSSDKSKSVGQSKSPKTKHQPSNHSLNSVDLPQEPPTLEKIDTKSSSSVPSPSESTSTEGDIPPPLLICVKDKGGSDLDDTNRTVENNGICQDTAKNEQQAPVAKEAEELEVQLPPTNSQPLSPTMKTPSPKQKQKSEQKPKPKPAPVPIPAKSKPTQKPRQKPKPKLNTKLESSIVTPGKKVEIKEPKIVAPPPEIISPELKSTIQGMLKHGESGPTVLLYKNPGTLTPEYGRKDTRMHKEDFILVIQTPVQRQLMQMFSDVINIDGHKGRPKDLKLMWVIVLDEFREAIPVAWLITNSTDDRMLSIFFRVLQSHCGDIPTNFLMAPLSTGHEYCTMWSSVFKSGTVPQLILNEEETKRDMRIEVAETFPDSLSRRKLNTLMNQLMWAVSQRQFDEAYEEMKSFLENKDDEKGRLFFQNYTKNWISRAKEWDFLHRIGSPVNTLYASDSFGKLKKFIAFKGTRILNSCIDPVLKIGYDKCFSRSKKIFKGDQKLLRAMEEIEMQHGWGAEIDPDNFVMIKSESQQHNEDQNKDQIEDAENDGFRFCVKDPEKNCDYFVFNTQSPCRCKFICSKCEICVHQFICTCPLSGIEHQMCAHIHFVQMMTQMQQSQKNQNQNLRQNQTPNQLQISHDEFQVDLDSQDDDQEGTVSDVNISVSDVAIETVDLEIVEGSDPHHVILIRQQDGMEEATG